MFDFPASPSVGQTFTPAGGPIYTWDGEKWVSSTGSVIYAGDTPPSSPADNSLWWNSSDGSLYIYFNDGNSKQWVAVTASPPIGGTTMPQGRLTLSTGLPVMSVGVAGATSIIYAPYTGMLVPVWNGSNLVPTSMGGELSQLNNDTTKSPAATVAAKNYDVFYWLDAGIPRISRGPAWTSDSVRGAPTDLIRVGGILVNNAAITNGPAAQRGTYLGTIRTNAANVNMDLSFGGNLVAGNIPVWNAYNRVNVGTISYDPSAAYNYTSAAWRASNGSGVTRCSFVIGVQEDAWKAHYGHVLTASPSGGTLIAGIGWNSVAGAVLPAAMLSLGAVAASVSAQVSSNIEVFPAPGFHFLAGLEFGGVGGNFGSATSPPGITVTGRY